MRIRGRSLPFPPLIPSPSSSSSTPLKSESATTADQYPTTTTTGAGFDRAEAKDELLTLLHPNAARRSALSPPVSTSTSSTQFLWKKEEPADDDADADEKKKKKKGGENEIFPEFNSNRLNAKAINTVNRVTSTGCQDKDQGKPADHCTTAKNKQKEAKAMAAKEKKTMRNSAVLLEGSRCSRVNGRGWRCCQPTLVGYLLCEHHLGKGRTRNMISNASRGQLGCTESKRNLFEGRSVDEAARKKRNVVPTVKARSISSLLDDGADH